MSTRLIRFLCASLLAIACSLGVSLSGQDAGGVDERTRLMQEYMARRAEWMEVRKQALEKIKAAKDEKEKKQHREKLAEDEKPYLEKMTMVGQAYAAAEKAYRAQAEAQGRPAK